MVEIELNGVPRLRAGISRLQVEATCLAEALFSLSARCPALAGTVIRGDRLHPAYKASINSDRFVDDPAEVLRPGDVLLILAADVGG